MNLQEYYDKIKVIGFQENPYFSGEQRFHEVVDYDSTTLELKIHLAEVIICRCFGANGGIYYPQDSEWFIHNFMKDHSTDLLRPWYTGTINEAIGMITQEDDMNKMIIGITFMFGVVEFYAKYKLGFRPDDFDFFDEANLKFYRRMFIGDAINKVKKTDTSIGRSLSKIDKQNIKRLKELQWEERRWTRARISDKLTLERNAMLHGEAYGFYDKGEYLVMLYILFHLNELNEHKV